MTKEWFYSQKAHLLVGETDMSIFSLLLVRLCVSHVQRDGGNTGMGLRLNIYTVLGTQTKNAYKQLSVLQLSMVIGYFVLFETKEKFSF